MVNSLADLTRWKENVWDPASDVAHQFLAKSATLPDPYALVSSWGSHWLQAPQTDVVESVASLFPCLLHS